MTTLNKATVTVGYRTFILPYNAAILLIKALANAERIEDGYSDEKIQIVPLSKDEWNIQPFSQKQYDDIKAAMLLDITYKEYKENANKRSEESS
jgi:hypothetical protein